MNMNKIDRIRLQIEELRTEMSREIEASKISNALGDIVNSDFDKIDDSYSLYPRNERSVFTFGLPRGVGKTRFIVDQAKNNENMSVIWFNNFQTFQRILSEEKDFPKDRCIILWGSTINIPVGIRFSKPITQILVDEYQKLSGENLSRIVDDCYTLNQDNTEIKIIRVGTPPL